MDDPATFLNRKGRRLVKNKLPHLRLDPEEEEDNDEEEAIPRPPDPPKGPYDPCSSTELLTEADFPRLRKEWLDEYKELTGPIPQVLPPFREINHEIHLIDPDKTYPFRSAKCPDHFLPQMHEKIARYEKSGWWEPGKASSSVPILCVPKKNGKLRTPMDCRARNDNTVKDATPFPDQDRIRNDVARAKYRSKLDMSEAFEQIRVIPEHVKHTAFTTVKGTYFSHVIQQGDCNGPSTFQRLMTAIYRDHLGLFVHVYLDDIFIYSDSIEDHQRHLKIVFDVLREQKLYLSADKVDLYSNHMECLGHVIDDQGIHADTEKMEKIAGWPTPQTYNDVQRYLGLVQYIAQFMPDVSSYTTPLSSSVRNGREFLWTPLKQQCFDKIKALAGRSPILKPIDPKLLEPIWVICDASVSGIGAMYRQGLT